MNIHPSIAAVLCPILGLVAISPFIFFSTVAGFIIALFWVNVLFVCLLAYPVMLFTHSYLVFKAASGYWQYSAIGCALAFPAVVFLILAKSPWEAPVLIVVWVVLSFVIFRALVGPLSGNSARVEPYSNVK
ncbi:MULTISPECIES: hypothetical protein [unclassified Halomonas]|uniref:hypothetical protein n=1 Tax=unclassified Halomonas TaxID=2609666 RepID=UPI0007D96E85|nr:MULTISPECIES: hypothetical protein [unclassified Halomonas]MBT2785002.1 hypothetical protein [Halomonas sp. ISL-106]MBT2796696.1 hypothetical protein [Halomonas sp. ISL-104]OAL59927.1 hypothetical protein A6R74_01265 [Halomonas sp. ALS9]